MYVFEKAEIKISPWIEFECFRVFRYLPKLRSPHARECLTWRPPNNHVNSFLGALDAELCKKSLWFSKCDVSRFGMSIEKMPFHGKKIRCMSACGYWFNLNGRDQFEARSMKTKREPPAPGKKVKNSRSLAACDARDLPEDWLFRVG